MEHIKFDSEHAHNMYVSGQNTPPMKPFIFEQWHAWQNDNPFHPRILLSDESTKKLTEFMTTDETINWLFVNGHKPAARALNSHSKAG